MERNRNKVVVGLGNPGTRYEWTRHNIGYLVLRALARQKEIVFKKESRFEGEMASWKEGDQTNYLFLPTTYMNLSGKAVKKVVDFYQLEFKSENSLIIVSDEVFLDFETLRLRRKGSAGGHNGLKSIEEHLQSTLYPRLRMGIGPKSEFVPLEDFVLQSFNEKEKDKLPSFIDRGISILNCWFVSGIDQAMLKAKREEK